MAKECLLYVGEGYNTFLSDPNKDHNILIAYLTDKQNRVFPKFDAAFFDNKPKPKQLKHPVSAGKEVLVCYVSKFSAPLPQSSFVVGKVYRLPELVPIVVNTAAEMSYSANRAAESKAVADYGKLIVDAQQANDACAAQMWKNGLDTAKASLSQPITFEQIVKRLAAHLLIQKK